MAWCGTPWGFGEGRELRTRGNREHGNERMHTLLNERIGNDIPIKKPNKTPINVVTISLILSFALLAKTL